MPARYQVRLTHAEREHLRSLSRRGTTRARVITRARALLLADRRLRDTEIATAVGLHERSIVRLRRRAVEEGVLAAIEERPRPGARPKLNPGQQAHLVALACSEPPEGRTHWTMQLLADRLVVELEDLDAVSDETVRRTLKKTISSPGGNSNGAFQRSVRSS